MAGRDIEAGVHLCRVAGWNQRRADWELFYRLNPAGCFVAEHDGQVVGTVTTFDYAGKLAWIAMVLVDPAHRGRGIGAMLTRTSVEAVAHCPCAKLDATPAGKRLYGKLGFVDEYTLGRFAIPAAPALAPPGPTRARTMRNTDVEAVVALDRRVFGVERGAVIEGLRAMMPPYALVVESAGSIIGFSLGRHGERFEQIGPLAAADEQTAKALAAEAFARTRAKPIIIDVPHSIPEWVQWLKALGFTEQRPFTRMYKGDNEVHADINRTFAISGPEFG